jgi:hypothetical protein
MEKKLIEKYRQYAESSEAFAVLFVKEYCKKPCSERELDIG